MSGADPFDFAAPPDSRWTVRGAAGELTGLLRRTADFLDSLGPVAVSALRLDREGERAAVTVVFDHWQLPADLDYLDPRVAGDPGHGVGPRHDHDFMVALADEVDARTIVDFGCGWGELAVALAADRERRVVGVDPAKAMLDIARARDGADRVDWVWGGAGELRVRDADLIVMTGNIPSIYVTDEAWDELLAALHAALRPGGRLAFGSWNPGARPWEQWGWDGIVVRFAANKGARVRAGWASGADGDDDERLYAGSEWRYRTSDELAESLSRAGFEIERTYGDWNRTPLAPDSPDIVVVARRRSTAAARPPKRHAHEVDVDEELVRGLVGDQFPTWADLPLRLVEETGTDHTIYRLGDGLAARLPIVPGPVAQAAKEARWLPFLAPRLPLQLPAPVALGAPGRGYPYPWSIVTWIDGERATPATVDPVGAAEDLAAFVRALHECDPTGGPPAGPDTGARGLSLSWWDERVADSVSRLRSLDIALPDGVLSVWDEARGAPEWDRGPVWFHGDLPGNLIARNRRLAGVIDSGYGIGDPACDLLPGWTFFRGAARSRFFDAAGLDDATIVRSKGWAIAPAIIGLWYYAAVPHLQANAIGALEGVLAD